MAKAELFKNPLLGWWLKKLWAFPIRRGEGDFGALKLALKYLQDGDPVLVFPEGTRRSGARSTKIPPGSGFLAIKSGVPVIPVRVEGSQRVMPPGSKCFKRHMVTVTYGKPFFLKDYSSYEEASKHILDKIDQLASVFSCVFKISHQICYAFYVFQAIVHRMDLINFATG